MNNIMNWLLHDRRLQAVSNLVCIVIGIFSGLALADLSPAEGWMSKWQTLVTGAMAIAAALLTIERMRHDDRNQENRHQDLIWMNRRRDRVRVARAAIPFAEYIRSYAEELALAVSVAREIPISVESVSGNYQTMIRKVSQLQEQLDDAIDDASELFGRPMFLRFRVMEVEMAEIIEQQLPAVSSADLLYGDTTPSPYVQEFIEEYKALLERSDKLASIAQRFAGDLKELWSAYRSVDENPRLSFTATHRTKPLPGRS